MHQKVSSLIWSFLLFVLPVAIPMNHLDAHADSPDPDEIAHMKFGHTKVEGVVTQLKSVAVRYGLDVIKVGDEMILYINEGNNVMDARKKGTHNLSPHFMSGSLISINYGVSQMTVLMSDGKKKSFKLRPASRMFTDIAVGTPVTFATNEVGEVIDLHVDSTSDVPRSGLNPDNKSALKGFRHLGKTE
jgi:hypothetical protein